MIVIIVTLSISLFLRMLHQLRFEAGEKVYVRDKLSILPL